MRKTVARLLLSFSLVFSTVPAAAWAQPAVDDAEGSDCAVETQYAPDQIIVVYDDAGDDADAAQVEEEVEDTGLQVTDVIADATEDTGTMVVADVADGQDVQDAIEAAEEVPGVAYAQPDYTYVPLEDDTTAKQLTDDPATQKDSASASANQYYLYGDESDTKGIKGANVLEAWDYVTNEDDPVTIAVIDSGVNLTHEDLADRILTDYCYDFYHDKKLEATGNFNGDYFGHGTHVAGIAAGTANNGKGIAGASYNANIIAYKIFDDSTSDPKGSTAGVVKAYEAMMNLADAHPELNIRVANLSLGTYEDEGDDDTALHDVIKAAKEKGILSVCAGGNGKDGKPYTTSMYPSDYDECLSVTALNADGTNATWSDFNAAKDISAPGVSIYSTYNQNSASYKKQNGTSMAAPLVSGIAALMWAASPAASVDDVVKTIKDTAADIDDSTDTYKRNTTGWQGTKSGSAGAIDATAAVLAIDDVSIAVPEGADTLDRSESVQLSASLNDSASAADDDITWSWDIVGGTGKATVNDEGLVTAIGAGTVIVRATAQVGSRSFSTRRVLTVSDAMPLVSASIASIPAQAYTGAAIKPALTVTAFDGTVLKEGTDYTLAYANNIALGKASVTVTGIGSCSGVLSTSFDIVSADIASQSFASLPSMTCTGKALTPSLSVKNAVTGKALVAGTDYTLAYANNVAVGKATVTVTGKGNYTGSVIKTFTIGLGKATVSKLKSKAKKKATVTWKKVNGAAKYQVAYKVGSGKWKYKTTSKKSLALKKLKSKKKLTVKVRACKTVSGKVVYGAWSKTKKVKVK